MVVLSIASQRPEPRHDGRTLSEWLLVYMDRAAPEDPKSASAAAAIRTIGTNALPRLVKWIASSPSDSSAAWRYRLLDLIQKLPAPAIQSAPMQRVYQLCYGEAQRTRANAAAFGGFKLLGAQATPAIPALCRIAKRRELHDAGMLAMCALCQMDEQGVPPLLDLASDPQNRNRSSAAFYLGFMGRYHHLGTNTHKAVVVLTTCLNEKDVGYSLAYSATAALGEIAVEPEIAVPALARTLGHTNGDVRVEAACSLGRFGAGARAAVPALVKNLADNNPVAAMAAARTLGEMAVEPDVAVPPLAQCLGAKHFQIRQTVAWALGQFNDRARSALPALLKALNDEDSEVRRQAKRAIWRIDQEVYEREHLRTQGEQHD